ncbi:hypothetical protein [Actinoallomurus acaciae]|uniref:Uncharacterized protein n=1 Tax=Actinoallomurus acaciae TaxID=502577 RepID=A0ABV5YDD5_9ACTN
MHDATHGWTAPGVLVIAVSVVLLVPGFGAGRDRRVGEEAPGDRRTATV